MLKALVVIYFVSGGSLAIEKTPEVLVETAAECKAQTDEIFGKVSSPPVIRAIIAQYGPIKNIRGLCVRDDAAA